MDKLEGDNVWQLEGDNVWQHLIPFLPTSESTSKGAADAHEGCSAADMWVKLMALLEPAVNVVPAPQKKPRRAFTIHDVAGPAATMAGKKIHISDVASQ